MISSTVVNFFANSHLFSNDFKNYVLSTYFPFLMEDQEKLTVAAKDYKLNSVEAELLSTIDGSLLSPRTILHKVDKIRLNRFIVSTNEYSTANNEQNNNQYIKTQSGKYFLVDKIVRVKDSVFLFCYEYINLKPYSVKHGIEFKHIQFTTQLSLNLQIIPASEISRPFSLVAFKGQFILFDLFNCHI